MAVIKPEVLFQAVNCENNEISNELAYILQDQLYRKFKYDELLTYFYYWHIFEAHLILFRANQAGIHIRY